MVKELRGTFVGREGDAMKFEVDGINMSFQAKDVKNISMDSASAPKKSQGKVAGKSHNSAAPVIIPAGTTITVKLSDTLDSGRHAKGHKFGGVLEGSLVSNDVTVAAAGNKVYGLVIEAVKSRQVVGNAKLIIVITDINIGGQLTPVTTDGINALAQSTGASSVRKVGGSAVIGTLADGSHGARTGAKVGLGVAILSRGNQAVIPARILLEFKLTQPLEKK